MCVCICVSVLALKTGAAAELQEGFDGGAQLRERHDNLLVLCPFLSLAVRLLLVRPPRPPSLSVCCCAALKDLSHTRRIIRVNCADRRHNTQPPSNGMMLDKKPASDMG
mmetsp:Transcript_56826/g.116361  ORF Transcript_56826/g.116361 Transcript_56826/m.116361 type:complete len:109 (+) Transcript_56826:783-1109(+)